jgi:hypothetical protein
MRRAVLALVAFVSTIPFSSTAAVYPVKKSANGRYLVDQNDAPYLIVGDSPQALMVNISEAEAEAFFANRSAYGFNSVWINLLCTTYTGGRPDAGTLDGLHPFTGTIPSTSSYDPTEVHRRVIPVEVVEDGRERGSRTTHDGMESPLTPRS